MAIAGAPIFAGGSAATLIMTSTLKEMNLTTAATFCIVLYVTQKFIGVPIAGWDAFRISRSKFTISIAPIAQSNPLFPLFVPALSIACSIVSVVSTPNITGTLLARETCAIPFETSLHT